MATATEMTKNAFNIYLKRKKEGKALIMKDIMKEAGYSEETSKHPGVLVASVGWQELRKTLNEGNAIKTFNDLASDENEDKRSRLDASKEILKILDRYPAHKSKIIGLFDKLEEIDEDDDKPDETSTGD